MLSVATPHLAALGLHIGCNVDERQRLPCSIGPFPNGPAGYRTATSDRVLAQSNVWALRSPGMRCADRAGERVGYCSHGASCGQAAEACRAPSGVSNAMSCGVPARASPPTPMPFSQVARTSVEYTTRLVHMCMGPGCSRTQARTSNVVSHAAGAFL